MDSAAAGSVPVPGDGGLPAAPPREHHRPRAPGQRRAGLGRAWLSMIGPAFVASVAYVDPGNFATNAQAGGGFGYRLLWVGVAANLTGMGVQYLASKVGLATGEDLAALCRRRYPRYLVMPLWVQAELVAMATDLAEVVGGSIALNLLFGIGLIAGGVITGAVALAILAAQGARGGRGGTYETLICGLLGVVTIGFLYSLIRVPPDARAAVSGLVPASPGGSEFLIAGMVGATVMPHVIYLHSALAAERTGYLGAARRHALWRFQRFDVGIAMTIAGLVNAAMLIVFAALFARGGLAPDPGISLPGAQRLLGAEAGHGVAVAFALALLASGFASSSVGAHAGQVVMRGFTGRSIPLLARRVVTLAPALAVLALGVGATQALVASQVALSFGIPFALVLLILITRDRRVMGDYVNRRATTIAACCAAALIIAVNVIVIVG